MGMRVAILAMLVVGTLWAAAAAGPATGPGQGLRVTPVVEAYRKAGPAVVNISTERLVASGRRLFGDGDDPFEEFMERLFGRTVPAISLGSGFLIHPEGYIITNTHVVQRAQKITATLADKSTYEAVVVAANSTDDLAVLKIKDPAGRRFAFLRLGQSDDLMIGETAIAIGNPLGYQNTCTTGVISALNRKLEFRGGVVYDGLIQTDAPINPGSSGGPLLNIAGELIGINTAIRADAQGIGFATPVGRLAADIPKLLDFERMNRVVFGLSVRQLHAEAGEELLVEAVAAGTPAAEAGCKAGDRLLALDGKALSQLPEFQVAMLKVAAGANVRLGLLRGGKRVDVVVRLKPRPKPDGGALSEGLLGLQLRTVTPDLAGQLQLPVEAGLLVTEVVPGGPADRLGIRRRDIVIQLGRFYVADLDEIGAVLEDVRPGDSLRIDIIRGRTRAWATITARQPPAAPAKEKLRI